MAPRLAARFAEPAALVADVVIAALAPDSFVFASPIAAVDAGNPLGVRKTLKCAVRVVIPQHLADDYKEVVDPALFQSFGDWLRSISLAENLVTDVGMGNVGVGRVEGVDSILQSRAVEGGPFELDLKGPEVLLRQLDRLGRDRERVLFEVDMERIEFLVQGHQVAEDLCGRGDRPRGAGFGEPRGERFELSNQAAQLAVGFRFEQPQAGLPVLLAQLGNSGQPLLAALPLGRGQCQAGANLILEDQPLLHVHGDAP